MMQTARMSSAPQHLQALERANAVRLARAALKRAVAAGEISAADIILDAPWEAESMTVADLLTSQRRWGHTRCRRFLQSIPLSESKTVGLDDRASAPGSRHAARSAVGRRGAGARPGAGGRCRLRRDPRSRGLSPARRAQAAAQISRMCPSGSRR